MNCQDARDVNTGAVLPGKISIGPKWYTPMVYIKAARELMVGIDIDPATDEEAQKRIKAKVYYTKETNGLSHPWYGKLLLCAPFPYPEYSVHGSVFFYLGKNPKGFVKIFSKFGVCYEKESA